MGPVHVAAVDGHQEREPCCGAAHSVAGRHGVVGVSQVEPKLRVDLPQGAA